MKVSARSIGDAVSEFYDIPYEVLTGRSRKYPIARARHVWYYLALKKFGHTSAHMGRISKRDHTTVIYGSRRIECQGLEPDAEGWLVANANHRENYKRSKLNGTTTPTHD